MKKMTMDRVSVLTVQYQQYSWEYMLDSFEKIGVKNIEMWPGEPHYLSLIHIYAPQQPLVHKGVDGGADGQAADPVHFR